MSRTRLFRQDDFTGGLNLRADQFQLAQNESPRLLNVEIDPRGGVFSRGAMRRINSTEVPVTPWKPEVLFPFYGNTHHLMLSTGKDGAVNGDVFSSTGSNFTSIAVPVSEEHGASFAAWGDILYMATGHDTQSRRWNTSTTTALTASGPSAWQDSYTTGLSGAHMPKAKHAVTHAGKLFVANTKEGEEVFPDRIRWSHPNSPGNWAYADHINIETGSKGITGLAVVAGHLLVFKRNSVHAIFGYDSDTFQVVEISRTVGVENPHCVVSTERGVYFYSHPDGLMWYNGERIVDLFEQIRPAIQQNYVNQNATDEVYVSYINRRVWVSVPYNENGSATLPTRSFVYDPSVSQRGAWVQFATADSYGLVGGCSFVTTAGDTIHVAAHPTAKRVLEVDLYNTPYDNITGTDAAFASFYRTRWIDGGSYSQKKMFRRPDMVVKQNPTATTIVVKAFADYEESDAGQIRQYDVVVEAAGTGMLWGTSTWGSLWGSSNRGSQIEKGRGIGLAQALQVEFAGTPGFNWGLNSYTLKYNPRRVSA